jgi:hypothetical protein
MHKYDKQDVHNKVIVGYETKLVRNNNETENKEQNGDFFFIQ